MDTTRREVLALAAGGTLALASPLVGYAAEPAPMEVSAIEDLMREHGILERVLLIYDEGIQRIESKDDIDPSVKFTPTLIKP